MTTSTKRTDGGEHDIDANNAEADRQIASDVLGWLQARGLYDPRDYECEGPDVAELLTEHEQNIAPQAKGGEPAPWSEDEEDAERLLACASRRKKYGDENCECDEDGSCVECEYDMQDVLKKRYAPLKHIATPAPQPPVEGLRGAVPINDLIQMFLDSGYDDKKAGSAAYESFSFTKFFEVYRAALASPSLTAEPVAWRVKNDFGHWYITQDKAMADTYRDIEKLNVEPLYAAPATLIEQSDSEKT